MTRDLPNFLVIGAARSGTTALYQALAKHPQVFMSPVKEPNFFAFAPGELDFAGPGAEFVNNSVNDLTSYRRLFAESGARRAVGEASPLYLYSQGAAARIARTLGQVKLVLVLRDPVEQAYSHYLYARARMIEPLEDFEAALDAEEARAAANWQPLFQYSRFPRYGEQIARFLEHFRREDMLIHLYEDYLADPDAVHRDIFTFLAVDANFVPPRGRVNMGGEPRNAGFQRVLMRPTVLSPVLRRVLSDAARDRLRARLAGGNIVRPPMPEAARQRLCAALAEDIARTAGLIGRDLSHWLKVTPEHARERSIA